MKSLRGTIDELSEKWGVPSDQILELLSQFTLLSQLSEGQASSSETINLESLLIDHEPSSLISSETGIFIEGEEEAEDGNSTDSSDVLEAGLLAGRYQDLGLIGKGGMGEVRCVRDTLLHRTLAGPA